MTRMKAIPKKAVTAKKKAAAAKAPASLATFASEFLKDVPPEAAGGSYGPTMNDRWHGKKHKIRDGSHEHSGWLFTFANGVFVGATRA